MAWEFVIPKAIAEHGLPNATDLPMIPMDSEAFAAFYERSARSLWAYVMRVSGDAALADDVSQEAYVRFLCAERPPSLADGEVASRKYLFRIATNLLRDHWRRPGSTSIEDVSEELFASSSGEALSDSQALLMPAMARLRPRDRQILWLAHAEGCSHREIAEITGLGSASIRLLLFRARRKMAHMLRNPDETPHGTRPHGLGNGLDNGLNDRSAS